MTFRPFHLRQLPNGTPLATKEARERKSRVGSSDHGCDRGPGHSEDLCPGGRAGQQRQRGKAGYIEIVPHLLPKNIVCQEPADVEQLEKVIVTLGAASC